MGGADRLTVLGFLRLREWWELHRQLKLQCEGSCGLRNGTKAFAKRKPGWGGVVAGSTAKATFPRLIRVDSAKETLTGFCLRGPSLRPDRRPADADRTSWRTRRYDDRGGRKFQLFPVETRIKPPPWCCRRPCSIPRSVIADGNAGIDPDWAIAELRTLLARRHHDPHWSRAGPRARQRTDLAVRAGARAEEAGALRRFFFRRSRADLRARGAADRRDQYPQRSCSATCARWNWRSRGSPCAASAWWWTRTGRRAGTDRLPEHAHNAQALDAWVSKLPKERGRWNGRATTCWSPTRPMRAVSGVHRARRRAPGRALPLSIRRGRRRHDRRSRCCILLNALGWRGLSWLAPVFVADRPRR